MFTAFDQKTFSKKLRALGTLGCPYDMYYSGEVLGQVGRVSLQLFRAPLWWNRSLFVLPKKTFVTPVGDHQTYSARPVPSEVRGVGYAYTVRELRRKQRALDTLGIRYTTHWHGALKYLSGAHFGDGEWKIIERHLFGGFTVELFNNRPVSKLPLPPPLKGLTERHPAAEQPVRRLPGTGFFKVYSSTDVFPL